MSHDAPARPVIAFFDCFPAWGGGEVELVARMRSLALAGYEPVLIAPVESPYMTRHRPAGVRVIGVRIGKSITDWGGRPQPGRAAVDYALVTARLVRLLRGVRPVMVHAVGSRSAKTVLASAQMLRLPLTWSAGNLYQPGKLDRLLLECSAAVFCPSHAIREQYRGLARDFSSVHLLPNTVETRVFQQADGSGFRQELGLRPTDTLVGVVGRVSPPKGQLEFLTAIAPMLRDRPDLHAVVVGSAQEQDAGYWEALKRFVAASGCSEQVYLTGQRDDIPEVMRALDIFALPSYAEPFGIVLIEAMAAGAPVIANRQGAVPEIVVDGETGLHFDLSEPGSLERALAALLDDAERRARMGAAGNARARVLYDRQNAHPRFVAVINEVVARRDRV